MDLENNTRPNLSKMECQKSFEQHFINSFQMNTILTNSFLQPSHYQSLNVFINEADEQTLVKVAKRLTIKLVNILQHWKELKKTQLWIKKYFLEVMTNLSNKLSTYPDKSKFTRFLFLLESYTTKEKENFEFLFDNHSHLQNSEINHQINAILKQKLLLPNHSCLTCSRVFYPLHLNTLNQLTVCLSKTEALDEHILTASICALKNSVEGGIILVGEKNKKGFLFGIMINPQEEENMQREFHNSLNQIYPKNRNDWVNISFVPFYENYAKFNESFQQKYIVRITVKGLSRDTSYVQERICGETIYKFFKICGNKGGNKENIRKRIKKMDEQDIYQFMVKIFRKKKKSHKNLHWNSECVQPFQPPSERKNSNSPLKTLQKKTQKIYKSQIVFIVGSKKKEALIQQIKAELEQYHSKFSLSKPFEEIKSELSLSIWWLSHEEKTNFIQNLIKKIDKGLTINQAQPTQTICLIFNQVQENLFSRMQNALQAKFTNCSMKRRQKWLKFSTKKQAIFGFAFLQYHGIKCLFVRNETD